MPNYTGSVTCTSTFFHFNSDTEIQLSDYKWDPDTENHTLILPPEKLKTSDYNWPGKQISQETTNHNEIQL